MAFGYIDSGELPHEQRGESATRALEAMVAAAFAVGPPNALRDRARGRAPTAFARQVAIYLAHTRLGMNFTEAGARFNRDRTTAAHACRTVEDKRENPSIDAILDFLERAIEVCPALRRAA